MLLGNSKKNGQFNIAKLDFLLLTLALKPLLYKLAVVAKIQKKCHFFNKLVKKTDLVDRSR